MFAYTISIIILYPAGRCKSDNTEVTKIHYNYRIIYFLHTIIIIQMIRCFTEPRRKNEVVTNTDEAWEKELVSIVTIMYLCTYYTVLDSPV